MKDSFRPAGTLKEFYGELDGLKRSQAPVVIWQTDLDGNRSTIKGSVKSYIANKNQTIINLFSSEVKNFKAELPVFIYEERKGILFKGDYDHYVNNILKIKADDRVFLKEKRVIGRLNFFYTKVMLSVKYGQKIQFEGVKLKDISECGFGAYVTEKMAIAFQENEFLNITSINGLEIPVSLEGTIIHKTPAEKIKGGKKGNVLIGVKFSSKSKLIKTVLKTLENL